MLLRTLYDDKLAQASYLLGCQQTGQAIVIDPNRDTAQYLALAKKEGLRITHVAETHIHADFASGIRQLADAAGAQLYVSGEGGSDWSYAFAGETNVTTVRDGDRFAVGAIAIDVIHTPGHTPEHVCFIITDTPVTDQPIGIFTGDFVFVGDVGRPDLLEKAAGIADTMRGAAHDLFDSLQKFRALPDYLQVWPGHGAGSACGKALGSMPQTTVGYEKLFSPAFAFHDADAFTDYILAGQPEPPKYFARMKQINRDGVRPARELRDPARLDAPRLAQVRSSATIVDTRATIAFGKSHIPGSINIPYNRSFTNWAGALIPYDKPFALVVAPAAIAGLHDMVRDLALIGLDDLIGYFVDDVIGSDAESLEAITTEQLAQLSERADVQVVDVRSAAEWSEGHIPGTSNIPLAQLRDRSRELPRDKQIVLHCQGGGRASIGSSVLQSLGFNVTNVRGGYSEWSKSGRPVQRAPQSDIDVQSEVGTGHSLGSQ